MTRLQLQPTLAITPFIFKYGTTCLLPLKIRGTADFASSSPSSLVARCGTHHQDQIVRPSANFPQHLWGDRFVTLPFNDSEFETYTRQVEVLKGLVKDMLMASTNDPIENMHMINSLCRLGVSYHFEDDIEEQLSHLFLTIPQLMKDEDYDLYTVAVIFQVFRSYGYKMPCDLFNKFKNEDGLFKEELASNIKGIISLYEASQWGMHEELILDEALAFTELHLKSLLSQSCPDHLREYIENALNRPYHKGAARLEAKQYISFCEKDESFKINDKLLKFAKYDFNRVQMLLQQEISLLSSWWNKLNIGSMFPYARQVIVESFFVAVILLFEPRYSRARNIMSKWYTALGLIDDTFDAYGLYEELQHLTNAVARFDTSAMDELPVDYLKNVYEVFINISNEIEEEVRKEGRLFAVSYIKGQVKKQVLGYHVQAQWMHQQNLPTFDEYLENGLWSIGCSTTLSLVMMGMEEADEDAYQWLINFDAKILTTMCVLGRLHNDIQSNEDEEKRDGQISGIACYMKEYGVSKKEAIESFRERIRAGWKDMNEGLMMVRASSKQPVAWQIIMAAFNIARACDIFYKDGEGFTYPEKIVKHYITKVLTDPIPLQHQE